MRTSLNQIFCNAFSSRLKSASNSVNKFHHLMPWSTNRAKRRMYCLPGKSMLAKAQNLTVGDAEVSCNWIS